MAFHSASQPREELSWTIFRGESRVGLPYRLRTYQGAPYPLLWELPWRCIYENRVS